MEEKRNEGNKIKSAKLQYLELIVNSFIKESNFTEGADEKILATYKSMVEPIKNQMLIMPENANDYQERLQILDRFYNYFINPDFREQIIKRGVTKQQLVLLLTEKLLGDNKRTYNMSSMFDERLVACNPNNKEQKNMRYAAVEGANHIFEDIEGKEVTIAKIGELRFVSAVGYESSISKYRIMKQVSGNNYHVYEVFSNINMMQMQDQEYKQAILEYLLSENNIQLSNSGSYIGEISRNTSECEDMKSGEEKKTASGNYIYKIDERFSLVYDKEDLSAVMLKESKSKEEKRLEGDER